MRERLKTHTFTFYLHQMHFQFPFVFFSRMPRIDSPRACNLHIAVHICTKDTLGALQNLDLIFQNLGLIRALIYSPFRAREIKHKTFFLIKIVTHYSCSLIVAEN